MAPSFSRKPEKLRRRSRILRVSLGIALALSTACGASVSAVYEGDVRFERCMALDWSPEIEPRLRRGCWEEWEKYFTLGQTRDRIEYAHLQLARLASTQVASNKPLLQVPEPTNVFAPPPMMMGDAGTPIQDDAGKPGAAPAKSECESVCDERAEQCQQLCRGPVCDKACAAKHSRCSARCTPTE